MRFNQFLQRFFLMLFICLVFSKPVSARGFGLRDGVMMGAGVLFSTTTVILVIKSLQKIKADSQASEQQSDVDLQLLGDDVSALCMPDFAKEQYCD